LRKGKEEESTLIKALQRGRAFAESSSKYYKGKTTSELSYRNLLEWRE